MVARPKLSKNLSMSQLGKEIDRQREVLKDKPVSDSLKNTMQNTLRTQSAASGKSTPRDKKAPSPMRKTNAFDHSFGRLSNTDAKKMSNKKK